MRIIIVKVGAIGDVIMALPMLVELKRRFPDSKITWLCGEIVSPILKEIDLIDSVLTVNELSLFKKGALHKILEIVKIWAKLFFKRFDLELLCHTDNRYRVFTIFSFSKVVRKLERNISKRFWPVPGRHHSHEYLRLVINEEIKRLPSISYPKLGNNIKLGEDLELIKQKNIIVIAPGGAKNYLNDDFLRRWPINNYVELTYKLIEIGFTVILIGSTSDSWVEPYFKDDRIINKIGQYNLIETISLLSIGKVLITHDSGPLHLSALAGIPCIGLFGPTIPHEKMPLSSNNLFLWGGENLACRPCYDGKTYANCKDNICLKEITPDIVSSQIKKLTSL